MKADWKNPIGTLTAGCSELISLAEQYWIHAGIIVLLISMAVLYLILKKGI